MNDLYEIEIRAKVNKALEDIKKLNKEFKKGSISVDSYRRTLAQLQTNLDNTKSSLNTSLKSASSITDAIKKNDKIYGAHNKVLNANDLMNKAVAETTSKLTKQINANKVAMASLGKTAKMNPFPGWAMSIMFFGMAMKQTFTSIARYGLTTFKDITSTMEGATTQSTLLEGEMKYLGFVIGDALQPIIGFLIPIISKISEWVENNPKLTASVIALGVALGTIFTVGGGGYLAYNGFKDFYTYINSKDWAAAGDKVKSGLTIGAIVLSIKWAGDAVESIKDGKFVDSLFESAASVMSAVGGYKLWNKQKGGGWFMVIGAVLKGLATDDFIKEIFATVGLVAALFTALGDMIYDKLKDNVKRAIFDGLTTVMALGIPGMEIFKDKMMKTMPSTSTKSFGDYYRNAYADTMLTGDYLQNEFNAWKQKIDDEVNLKKEGSGDTNLYFNDTKIGDADLAKSILDAVNKADISMLSGYNGG
jgi:hypothetical protein